MFSRFCDEFLIHAVDVEGKANGVEKELAKMLGNWNKIPITYAGGVHSFEDLKLLKELGHNKINVTIKMQMYRFPFVTPSLPSFFSFVPLCSFLLLFYFYCLNM